LKTNPIQIDSNRLLPPLYLTSNMSKAHETRDSLSSTYSQIVLIYLFHFRCNSLLKTTPQPQIAKKTLKPLFWTFKVVQGHRCWQQ